jgi:TldD protein
MSYTRRTFIKQAGAAGVALAASDLIADLLAQTPPGTVLKSKFKGLADIVLGEAKLAGCSYADVRFTMTSSLPGANASFNAGRAGGAGPGFRR